MDTGRITTLSGGFSFKEGWRSPTAWAKAKGIKNNIPIININDFKELVLPRVYLEEENNCPLFKKKAFLKIKTSSFPR
jgi:hypothetical protein